MKRAIIITTINKDVTTGIDAFSKVKDYRLILVGDTKSPKTYATDAEYLDIEKQHALYGAFSSILPLNHYSRKNIGYLFAIGQECSLIAESDDDNIPYGDWSKEPLANKHDVAVVSPEIPNVYALFTKAKIWPRGFPLELISTKQQIITERKELSVGVWQGLANDEADVDAVYRLVIGKEVTFDKNKRFVLDRGVLSPFNSQNTFWHEQAFPFMYLPCTVSFRYTDILRSYVAQYGLWARDLHLGFTSPTCYQNRNPHKLLRDFKDEVYMYLETMNVIEVLRACGPSLNGSDNDLLVLYEALHKAGVVEKKELEIVSLWLQFLEKARVKN